MHRTGLAITTVVSIACFTGLAVLGEGGVDAFIGKRPLVGLVVVTAALTIASLFTSVNFSSGKKEDHSNRWILWVVGAISIAAAWLPVYTDRANFWTIDGDGVRWTGVLLYSVGGLLRLWPVFILGNRFSGFAAIQHGHRLVTTGIYSAIRHPSYLGMLLLLLGWGLAFRSIVGVILAILTLIPLLGRIRSEEAILLQEFGAEYEAYRKRTSCLIPGIY
jgi:protein-S-isoprenylcysteine O-methyltransferase Ste14